MNKKLHILFLSGWYPSRVLPSNGDFVQRHAEAVATKHDVTLIHIVTDTKISQLERTNDVLNNVKTKIVYLPKSNNLFLKWLTFIKLYLFEIRKIKDFDLVHLNITYPLGIIALYLKWFKNKRYIISEHWSDYQPNLNKSIGFIRKKITQLITKNATFVCPVTDHLKKSMIDFGLNGNYFPVPNVIDTSVFFTSNQNPKTFTISHISGMQDEIKNISGIIKVISKIQHKIPKLKFNLIGENSKKYDTQIKSLKIKGINTIEHIPNHEVADYLRKSNLFILFSNYENLPCVIIESFACGIPVISTNVGGIGEYFPKKFGFLVNTRDETALEKAILKIYNKELISNKELMHTYAENNFGIDAICTTFSKLYLKSLNLN